MATRYDSPSVRRDAGRFARRSIVALVLMLLATTVHHAFRFGAGWTWNGLILVLVAIFLHLGAARNGKAWTAIAYGAYVGLAVLAFGILDGLLDHVLKIAGFRNVTMLEGSDRVYVETVFQLWSREATYRFYEGTGALTFALAIPATWYTVRYLQAHFRQ